MIVTDKAVLGENNYSGYRLFLITMNVFVALKESIDLGLDSPHMPRQYIFPWRRYHKQ